MFVNPLGDMCVFSPDALDKAELTFTSHVHEGSTYVRLERILTEQLLLADLPRRELSVVGGVG